jgi:hypothetical protein
MRFHTYGVAPTQAETRAVTLAGDNRSAPGTRNVGGQPLSAAEVTGSLADYNVESTKARKAADRAWHRPPASIAKPGPLMGSGPKRPPPSGAEEIRGPAPEKFNQHRAKMVQKFTAAGYERFKGPTLGDIYADLPARTIENRIAYAPDSGAAPPVSDVFETTLARAEELLKLAADAVARLGADYQPLLDEAQDILGIIADARISAAEIPPSVRTRIEVLEKGIAGQLGERVGLTRGVSPTELRAVVDAATAGMSTQVTDIAAIVATLAASIPAATTALISSATTAVVDAGATGGPTAALVAAIQAAMDMSGAASPSARKKAVEDLLPIAVKTLEADYKEVMAQISREFANKSTSTSNVTNPKYVAIQAAKAADPTSTWKIKDRVRAEKTAEETAAKSAYEAAIAGVLAMGATLAA